MIAIPLWRGVLGITILDLEGNWPPRAKNVNFLHPHCQTEVGGYIVYVMGIPLNTWTCKGTILFSITSIIYYFGIQTPYLHRDVSWESLYQIWRGTDPSEPKNGDFLYPQLTNWSWQPYCLCQGDPHDIIIGKTSCYRLFDFYTVQYQLCNISPWFQLKIAMAKM